MDLNDLGSPNFWQTVSRDGELRVTFVVPTGRAAECPNTNMALSSDGLLFPDLALAMNELAQAAGVKFRARTIFDIDAFEDTDPDTDPLLDNLIISGSANVSVVARQLLDNASAFDTYHAGFVKPYRDPKIASAQDTDDDDPSYNVFNSPSVGVLALYTNPWAANRIATLCSGLLAVGTIAAMTLLLEYLRGIAHGNNRFEPDVPVKIVEGQECEYQNTKIKPIRVCKPSMDVRNIVGITVKE